MEKRKINLYPPKIGKNSIKYFKKCISASMVSTGGDLISDFEKKIKNYTKSKYSVAFNSGTSALDIAFKACRIQENTEVIAPTLTFVATINAILYNRCLPVFMDCDEYYNIDTKKVLKFLKNETFVKNKKTYNKKTKKIISSIIVTHVWGNAVDLQKLLKECKLRNIKLIEDASESLGTFYKKKKFTQEHSEMLVSFHLTLIKLLHLVVAVCYLHKKKKFLTELIIYQLRLKMTLLILYTMKLAIIIE